MDISTIVTAAAALLVAALVGYVTYGLLRGPQTANRFVAASGEPAYQRRAAGYTDYWFQAWQRSGGGEVPHWVPAAVITAAPVLLFALITFITGNPLLGVLVGAAVPLVPWLLLRRQVAGRGKAIERQLPDFIDQVRVGMHGGALEPALRSAALGTSVPLSAEMALLLQDLDNRVPMRQALRNMAHRSATEAMTVVAATLEMFAETGTQNVQSILRELAAELTEMDRFNREVRASTVFLRIAQKLAVALPLAATVYTFSSSPSAWFSLVGVIALVVIVAITGGTWFYLGRLLKKSGEVA